MLDEVVPTDRDGVVGADWAGLTTRGSVSYILALSPLSTSDTLHSVTPPVDRQTLSVRLSTPYRNSRPIRQYLLYCVYHAASNYLSPSEDRELPGHLLPAGALPVWVERTEHVEDREVLEKVRDEYVGEGQTVTVLYNKDEDSEGGRQWCREQGWPYRAWHDYVGSEAGVVVVMGRAVAYPEAISRGRQGLVMVTTRGR